MPSMVLLSSNVVLGAPREIVVVGGLLALPHVLTATTTKGETKMEKRPAPTRATRTTTTMGNYIDESRQHTETPTTLVLLDAISCL